MPVIICIIIVMFLVLLGWTWSSLEDIEKTKFKKSIVILITVIIILTIIESNYLANAQNETLQIIDRLKK